METVAKIMNGRDELSSTLRPWAITEMRQVCMWELTVMGGGMEWTRGRSLGMGSNWDATRYVNVER